LRRSSRLTVLWLTPKTLAIHSWLVPPLLSAPIWQRSSYVTRRYLLIGDLLLSQKVTPSSPHSLMHWLLESALGRGGERPSAFWWFKTPSANSVRGLLRTCKWWRPNGDPD